MMNREKLFRGKRVDNSEWVEGYFFKAEEYCFIIHTHSKGEYLKKEHYASIKDCYNIIPETVGEYTGLTDKSGKKIFEGDILADFETSQNYVVEYDGKIACFILNNVDELKNDSFCGWDILSCWNLDMLNGDTFELDIIGNIHDNPDLMEVK